MSEYILDGKQIASKIAFSKEIYFTSRTKRSIAKIPYE